MAQRVIIVRETVDHLPLLLVWVIVIVIIAVVGLLSKDPPERINHSFHENNQKTQYITIGGASQTKTS
jgi:Mn2+/Fe2+ NRAMP family transporter